MTSSIRWVALVATVALLASASVASALGGIVGLGKPGAVKGAKYSGKARSSGVTITVSSSGGAATVSIPVAPTSCHGVGGGWVQHTRSGSITKNGAFTAKISYTPRRSSRVLATVLVKGTFLGSVFTGQAQSRFTSAGKCNGEASLVAKRA